MEKNTWTNISYGIAGTIPNCNRVLKSLNDLDACNIIWRLVIDSTHSFPHAHSQIDRQIDGAYNWSEIKIQFT